jgi:hypothetical protein
MFPPPSYHDPSCVRCMHEKNDSMRDKLCLLLNLQVIKAESPFTTHVYMNHPRKVDAITVWIILWFDHVMRTLQLLYQASAAVAIGTTSCVAAPLPKPLRTESSTFLTMATAFWSCKQQICLLTYCAKNLLWPLGRFCSNQCDHYHTLRCSPSVPVCTGQPLQCDTTNQLLGD